MMWQGPRIFNDLQSPAPDPTSRNPDHLLSILHSTITQFRVEFLVIGEPSDGIVKPHVLFHLTLRPCHSRQEFKVCRLSMEYTGEGPDRLGGALTIQSASFSGSHIKATGSFGFVLTPTGRNTKVRDWIKTLMGRCSQQQYPGAIGDMTKFDFVEKEVDALISSQMDGCRDWITQAVTRFYLLGLVTLCGQELEQTPALYNGRQVTYLNFNEEIPTRSGTIQPAPFWFPDIIDKKFLMTPTPQNPTGVTIQRIPMWRGRFYDPNFVRMETVNVYNRDRSQSFTFRYNYHDLPRPASASGPPGGPPRPQPPPGGRGGTGGTGGHGGTGGPSGHGGHGGPSGHGGTGGPGGPSGHGGTGGPGGPGQSSSSHSRGNGANKSAGGTKPSQAGGPQPPRPIAGTSQGQGQAGRKQGSGTPGSGTPGGGSSKSGGTPTVAKKHASSWVKVKINGQDKGQRDKNAVPDSQGWVPVYDTTSKRQTGVYNTKTQELKPTR